MSGVIENMTADIEDLRNEVAELKRKIESMESGSGRSIGEIFENAAEQLKVGAKNMQKRRDAIVERAKLDVRELTVHADTAGAYSGFLLGVRFGGIVVEEEFAINREKRTVVCLLKGVNSGIVRARGIAKCAPNDCFNVHIGKAIALRRALGLEVPSEYLNAPQPTEVRVGDIVRNEYTDTGGLGIGIFYTRTVASISEDKIRYTTGRFDKLHPMSRFEIIDDSRE